MLKAGIQGAVEGAKAGALIGLLGPILGGAVNAELSWGDFKDGLISGAISALVDVSGVAEGLGATIGSEAVAKAITSALVGGTVSEIGGGKFANGAISAAFQSMLVSAETGWFSWKHAFYSPRNRLPNDVGEVDQHCVFGDRVSGLNPVRRHF